MDKNTEKVNKEIQKVLEKNKMVIGYEVSFPMYKMLPAEVKLALSVLSKHGMKILITLSPQKKNK